MAVLSRFVALMLHLFGRNAAVVWEKRLPNRTFLTSAITGKRDCWLLVVATLTHFYPHLYFAFFCFLLRIYIHNQRRS